MRHKGMVGEGGRAAATLGEGGRFQALKQSIEERNRKGPKRPEVARKRPGGGKVRDVGALTSFLGAKAHGRAQMQKWAAAGRKRAQ